VIFTMAVHDGDMFHGNAVVRRCERVTTSCTTT